jgi:hypothetical protein
MQEEADAIRTPKWLLVVIVPLLGLTVTAIVGAVRNEIITNQSADAIERLESDLRRHMDEEAGVREAAALERHRMNERILYLCLERHEDNARRGGTPDGCAP